MRFTPKRQRSRRPGTARAPRIAISQDEITADLNYRGDEARRAGAPAPARQGRR
ncbi:MAG: hypothetical protein QM729_04475 [Solirubrobacterales bacterium]